MPLTINLLHEEQALVKLRKRDPLKLGLFALGGVALLFVAYYGYRLIGSNGIKQQLRVRQAEWAKQEPQANAAEELDRASNDKLSVASLVSQRIDHRFYWAPLLADLQKTVPPNVQILSFSGSNATKDDKVTVLLEGLAAGPVPRAAAEQFRVTLADVLSRSYKNAAATFRSLDETASAVAIAGRQTPTARFSIELRLDSQAPPPVLASAPETRSKHS